MIEFHQLVPEECFQDYKFRILYFYWSLECDTPILDSLILNLPLERIVKDVYQHTIDKVVLQHILGFHPSAFSPNISGFVCFGVGNNNYENCLFEKNTYNHMRENYLRFAYKSPDGKFTDKVSIFIEDSNWIYFGKCGYGVYFQRISTFLELAFELRTTLTDWFDIYQRLSQNFTKNVVA